MERIRALINKLQQQADQQDSAAVMMVTVQMLQTELSKFSPASQFASSSKISVVLPGGSASSYAPSAPATETDKVMAAAAPAAATETPPAYTRAQPDPRPVLAAAAPAKEPGWVADPLSDMPPLTEQKKEMNEAWGKAAPSLNDKLKTETTELGSLLTGAPVKDLKKAIGINDRFVFLHELFRGDEAVYERSIKTINNFRAYPEAEFWIERELKTKLAWDEAKDAVKYFRQLVRRRFI